MSLSKKLLFSTVTLLLVGLALEGVCRFIWWQRATQAFARTCQRGEEIIQAESAAINFMKQPDSLCTYVLRPNFAEGGVVVNAQGFAQRDSVPLPRTVGKLRLTALGESTTQGCNVDQGNYPLYLRRLLEKHAVTPGGVEVLNAGVSGWVSDQVALHAEHRVAAYQPDIVILYTGWNDFQSYDPYGPPPTHSYFETGCGGSRFHEEAASRLKSVAVLSALYQHCRSESAKKEMVPPGTKPEPDILYRFYLKSLDRTVAAFRAANPHSCIALCTLVGRWPHDTSDDFQSTLGRTWWMQLHGLTRPDAAGCLARFNALIRTYAATHGLVLIDTAAAYEGVDRARLFVDFAHMTFEGYELLAEVMYEGLRQGGALAGNPSPRRQDLLVNYKAGTRKTHLPETAPRGD